jgi:hypothetical protein
MAEVLDDAQADLLQDLSDLSTPMPRPSSDPRGFESHSSWWVSPYPRMFLKGDRWPGAPRATVPVSRA